MATITKGYVYWIHLPEHTDMTKEGYIGITNNIEERFRIHRGSYNERCTHVARAIKKYKEKLIFDVILEANYDYCMNIENKLRNAPNVGWNIAIGGGNSPTLGRKCTDNCIKALKKANSKNANVYRYGTDELIAENVIVSEWARENNCDKSCLCRTALKKEGRKQHKGFYIRYIDNEVL